MYSKREAQTVRNQRTSRGRKGANKRKHRKPEKFLRIYQCPDCGHWHLSKSR